jgi:hypothetical protein
MGITEDRHTIGITGIERITVTTVRTNNKTVPVAAMSISNPDCSP